MRKTKNKTRKKAEKASNEASAAAAAINTRLVDSLKIDRKCGKWMVFIQKK